MLVFHEVHAGNQAAIELKPVLYFGKLVRHVSVGDLLVNPETIQTESQTEFDLSKYPNGVVVTLNQKGSKSKLKYSFTGTSMQLEGQNQPSSRCHCRLI